MRRLMAVWAVVMLLVACDFARAQEAPAFTRHLREEDRNLFVISDPLPWLEALLTDERLAATLKEGRLAKGLPAGQIDSRAAWDWIKANQRWVPAQIAIGLSDGGLADVDHLVRSLMLLSLCRGAQHAEGDDAVAKELPKLQELLLADLKALQLPRLRIWLQYRDPGDAAGVLFMAKLKLPAANAPAGVRVHSEAGLHEISATISNLLDDEQRIDFLETMGVITGEDDPRAKLLSAAMAALTAKVTLEQREDGLVLTVGEGVERPLGAAGLTPAYKAEKGLISYGQWDARRLREAAAGWGKLWEEWRDTLSGRAEKEGGDAVGGMAMAGRQIERWAPRGAMRMWAENGVQLLVEEYDPPAAPGVNESTIRQFIPAHAEAWGVDTRIGLGQVLSDQLLEMEGRLDWHSFRADVGDDPASAERLEARRAAYYRHFAQVRELIHERAVKELPAPMAWVVTSRGKLASLELKVGDGQDVWERTLRDLPVMEMAWATRCADPAKAGALVEELAGELISAGFLAADHEPPAQVKGFAKADLGLGVETWALDRGWLANLPMEVKVQAAGDLAPHYLIVDEFLIISTSPRLSKRMLDARKGDEKGRGVLPEADGKVVAAGRLPGETLAAFLEQMGTWAVALDDALDPRQERLKETFGGMAEIVRLVEAFEWQAVDKGSVRTTNGRMRVGK